MMAKALIATPQSDAKLRKQFRKRGKEDRDAGIPRHDCPVDGLIAQWWREGWDDAQSAGQGKHEIDQ